MSRYGKILNSSQLTVYPVDKHCHIRNLVLSDIRINGVQVTGRGSDRTGVDILHMATFLIGLFFL